MFNTTIQDVKNEIYREEELDTLYDRDKDGEIDFDNYYAIINLIITPAKTLYKIWQKGKDNEFYDNLDEVKERIEEIKRGHSL